MPKSTFNNISENIGSGIHQDVFLHRRDPLDWIHRGFVFAASKYLW
jgi:hypothetical protein